MSNCVVKVKKDRRIIKVLSVKWSYQTEETLWPAQTFSCITRQDMKTVHLYGKTIHRVPVCNLIQRHFSVIICIHNINYFRLKCWRYERPALSQYPYRVFRDSQTLFTASNSRVYCHQDIPGKEERFNLTNFYFTLSILIKFHTSLRK